MKIDTLIREGKLIETIIGREPNVTRYFVSVCGHIDWLRNKMNIPNLHRLRRDNADDGPGLSPEEIDELIDYTEWLVYYYEKPHKFKPGNCPSICGLCGRKRELHDFKQAIKRVEYEADLLGENEELLSALKLAAKGILGRADIYPPGSDEETQILTAIRRSQNERLL